jgi:ribosomal protein S13
MLNIEYNYIKVSPMNLHPSKSNSFLKSNIKNYGIGLNILNKFKSKVGLNTRIKSVRLNSFHSTQFLKITKSLILNKPLKVFNRNAIEFIQALRTYKGIRHKLKYPCRGQRTHTNAKTVKKFKV